MQQPVLLQLSYYWHKARSKLDLLKPDTQYKVEQKQVHQAGTHDAHAKFWVLSVGNSMFVKTLHLELLWIGYLE